jgi:hypothetical protein
MKWRTPLAVLLGILLPLPANEVWMGCAPVCGLPDAPPCPEGTLCDSFRCRERCVPGVSAACEPDPWADD